MPSNSSATEVMGTFGIAERVMLFSTTLVFRGGGLLQKPYVGVGEM